MRVLSPRWLGLIFLVFIFLGNLLSKIDLARINNPIKILFPLSMLKPGIELLDPNNTETIWEYYLLENLSCGLVRDSQFSATGYEGCLAERFYQEDDHTWIFILRELKWSDGSLVLPAEIEKWIEDLRSVNKRHVKYLKLAREVSYDEKSRSLKMVFPFPMDKTILHELSLADSGLMPIDYVNKGWSKSVGPYFVEKWNPGGNILELKANTFFSLYQDAMPKSAMLSALQNPNQRSELFRSIDVDIVPLNATASPDVVGKVLPNAPQVYQSYPMSLIYFYFNHENSDTHEIANRKLFADVIASLRPQIAKALADLKIYSGEDQMVPVGFGGRLDKVELPSLKSKSAIRKITIRLQKSLRDFPSLLQLLSEAFLKHGVEVSFDYSDSLKFSNDHFAGAHNFLGNQLDSSGSWAFLTGQPFGPLSSWVEDYRKSYDEVFNNENVKERQRSLLNLHREVLQKYIAVPFMVGRQRYLLSDRIDASRWNQFDSRLRIYELRIK